MNWASAIILVSAVWSPSLALPYFDVLVNRMADHLYTKLCATTARPGVKSDFVVEKDGTYGFLHFFSNWSDKSYIRFVYIVEKCGDWAFILAFASVPIFFICLELWEDEGGQQQTMAVVECLIFFLSLSHFYALTKSFLPCILLSPRYNAIKEGISTIQHVNHGAVVYEPSTSPTEDMTEFSCYPDDSSFYNGDAETYRDETATIQRAFIENMDMLQQ